MVPLQLWYYHVPYSNEMSPSVMYKLKFTEQIHPHQTLTPPPSFPPFSTKSHPLLLHVASGGIFVILNLKFLEILQFYFNSSISRQLGKKHNNNKLRKSNFYPLTS